MKIRFRIFALINIVSLVVLFVAEGSYMGNSPMWNRFYSKSFIKNTSKYVSLIQSNSRGLESHSLSFTTAINNHYEALSEGYTATGRPTASFLSHLLS